jgi:hypothetical protein
MEKGQEAKLVAGGLTGCVLLLALFVLQMLFI